jgi:hypothetical protein
MKKIKLSLLNIPKDAKCDENGMWQWLAHTMLLPPPVQNQRATSDILCILYTYLSLSRHDLVTGTQCCRAVFKAMLQEKDARFSTEVKA